MSLTENSSKPVKICVIQLQLESIGAYSEGFLTNENSLLIQGSECDVYIILHILAAETCEHYVYWICFMNYNGIQTLGKDHTM